MMFADIAGHLLNILASCALGAVALSVIIIFASRSKKPRLLVLCGSALLIGFGLIFVALFLALKSGWQLVLLFGVVPFSAGCVGLAGLAKSRKRF
jgi:hypothetical protein